ACAPPPRGPPAGGSPTPPVAGRRAKPRRLDDDLLRTDAAGRYQAGQLDPDDAGQGLVHDPASLQPARVVLRQDLAPERDRTAAALTFPHARSGSTRVRGRPRRQRSGCVTLRELGGQPFFVTSGLFSRWSAHRAMAHVLLDLRVPWPHRSATSAGGRVGHRAPMLA